MNIALSSMWIICLIPWPLKSWVISSRMSFFSALGYIPDLISTRNHTTCKIVNPNDRNQQWKLPGFGCDDPENGHCWKNEMGQSEAWLIYVIKGLKHFPAELRSGRWRWRGEKHTGIASWVLYGTAAEAEKGDTGWVRGKGNLCFAVTRNIILLCPFSRHLSKKFKNSFYASLQVEMTFLWMQHHANTGHQGAQYHSGYTNTSPFGPPFPLTFHTRKILTSELKVETFSPLNPLLCLLYPSSFLWISFQLQIP